jgi:RNA polymerase sigma factor (sigma-70 family)
VASLDLERLFSDHAQALYAFLTYRVGDPTVAEDLLGDTFERAVRARRQFDRRKGREQTWLYTIALNCLRDHARKTTSERRARERSGAGALVGASSDGALDRVEDRDVLLRGLDGLDSGEREVVALRYGADLRLQDIAAVTGLPITTVNGRLYSGMRKLRQILEPGSDDTSP